MSIIYYIQDIVEYIDIFNNNAYLTYNEKSNNINCGDLVIFDNFIAKIISKSINDNKIYIFFYKVKL